MNSRRAPCGEQGFTLIEVVVALAILTLGLGALYENFGLTTHRATQIRHRELAWMTAQSLLSQAAAGAVFQVGRQSGTTPEGLTWQLTTQSYDDLPITDSPIKPFLVEITVSWSPGQAARLRAVELGRAAAVVP